MKKILLIGLTLASVFDADAMMPKPDVARGAITARLATLNAWADQVVGYCNDNSINIPRRPDVARGAITARLATLDAWADQVMQAYDIWQQQQQPAAAAPAPANAQQPVVLGVVQTWRDMATGGRPYTDLNPSQKPDLYSAVEPRDIDDLVDVTKTKKIAQAEQDVLNQLNALRVAKGFNKDGADYDKLIAYFGGVAQVVAANVNLDSFDPLVNSGGVLDGSQKAVQLKKLYNDVDMNSDSARKAELNSVDRLSVVIYVLASTLKAWGTAPQNPNADIFDYLQEAVGIFFDELARKRYDREPVQP